MKKTPNVLWITVLALGWLFDFLFWKQTFGINYAIFVALCLIGGFSLLWRNNQRAARGALWLIPLILFFAASTFVRAEPLTIFLGVLFTFFLMGLMANTFTGGRWFQYGVADYFAGFLKLAGSVIARPISFNAEVQRELSESGKQSSKTNFWAIARGVLIALPIVAIFAALLASADTIFSNQLSAFLNLAKLSEYIFRLIYILVIAYALAGSFLHAASQSTDEKLLGEDKPLVARFLGFTETAIVLGSVIVLFTAFVIVQFRYFFGGQANINIAGFTYSEYARRGYGELVAVAFFSLLMILGLGTITRRENAAQRRTYSGLSALVVVLVIVMLVSAYQRLALYEAAYGFSRLRAYTHVILIWIGLLLIAEVVLEILNRERAFALAILCASLGFAISLSLLNVDAFIAAQNINLATGGQKQPDVAYLAGLSEDEVPVLVNEFLSPSLPTPIHEAVGAALMCRSRYNQSHPSTDWRSFDLARWFADRAMERIQTELKTYTFDSGTSWPGQVHTPGNVVYACSND
jgi:hypothetical protein